MALFPNQKKLNSSVSIQERDNRGKLTLATCLWFLPLRTFFLFFGQSLFYVFYRLKGEKLSWVLAGKWWSVWGSLADLGCLLVLVLLMRREGLTISDLFKPFKNKVLWKGALTLLIVVPFAAVGSVLGSWVVYGNWHANLTPGILYDRHLPVWGIFYSFLIWAPVWSATEEMTYNGYLAARIEALGRRRWLTLSLVCFWWAVQHSFLPFIPDWRYFAWRFISFVPCVFALVIVYLRTRNLSVLILAHFVMDLGAVASTLAY